MTIDADIKALNEKMDTVLKVLQEFGLNFIQNVGNLKHSVSILTTNMESLNEQVIYLKGLGVKIEDLTKIKQELNSELKYIENLIKANQLGNLADNKSIGIEENKKDLSSVAILNTFKDKLSTYTELKKLTTDLEDIKESIFKITGGHRVLFEIANVIKDLKKESKLSEEIIKSLHEKIQFWINKLSN